MSKTAHEFHYEVDRVTGETGVTEGQQVVYPEYHGVGRTEDVLDLADDGSTTVLGTVHLRYKGKTTA